MHETVNTWGTRDDASIRALLVNHALPCLELPPHAVAALTVECAPR